MDNYSTYLLQKIDCNCSDCKFMIRDNEKKRLYDKQAGDQDKKFRISYGYCRKFNKEVTFIPGICQIDTQQCFEHRRDYIQTI